MCVTICIEQNANDLSGKKVNNIQILIHVKKAFLILLNTAKDIQQRANLIQSWQKTWHKMLELRI